MQFRIQELDASTIAFDKLPPETANLRVRVRRNPGALVIEGKQFDTSAITWPEAFFKIDDHLFAEVVYDYPEHIETADLAAYAGTLTREQVLSLASGLTFESQPMQLSGLEVGPLKLVAFDMEPPWGTAAALRFIDCVHPNSGPAPRRILVGIPSSSLVLGYPVIDESVEEEKAIVRVLEQLLPQLHEQAEEKQRVSPHVYISDPEGFYRAPTA